MQETVRLYDKNAYETEFEGIVLFCEKQEREGNVVFAVVLDQTLFFPEEGGQSPDQGMIDNIEVIDVQIQNGVITHYLADELSVGKKVQGKIDWKHRFYNMQQHSGEHIFSGLVHSQFGLDNVGFHLSNQVVTMDFNGVLTEKQVEEIEWAVNDAISKNIEIHVSFPSKEELDLLVYRSKIEIDGQVRIVTVPGYDVCACCAPHVRRTGEIGMLKVMSMQNYKGGVRISILCGFRALEVFREKTKIITDLVALLTTNQDNIVESVSRLKTQNQGLSIQLGQAKQALLEQKLKDIPVEEKDVILFETGLDVKIIRNIVNGLVESHEGMCGIFVGSDEEGYSYILGSKNVDCKEVGTILREKMSAKGGGSSQMIQGSLRGTKEEILQILLDR